MGSICAVLGSNVLPVDSFRRNNASIAYHLVMSNYNVPKWTRHVNSDQLAGCII